MKKLTFIMAVVFNPYVQVAIGHALKPFSQVHQVKIKSSWQQATDEATIRMPKNIGIRSKDKTLEQLNTHIKKGMPVTIQAGYAPKSVVEFQGFVTQVNKAVPLELTCEDYMYLLKLDSHRMSWKAATLKAVVRHIMAGEHIQKQRAAGFDFQLNIADAKLGKWSINALNGVQALNQIKDVFGLVSFFRIDPQGKQPPTLHVGFPYENQAAPTLKPTYRMGQNVVKWDLTYANAADVKIKIKAILNLKNGKKKVVEVGDPDGEVHTRNYGYGEISENELKAYAEDELKHYKHDGFKGSLTGFAQPLCRHGDVVKVDDPVYTKEAGEYFVKATELVITDKPTIRRKVTLDLSAA